MRSEGMMYLVSTPPEKRRATTCQSTCLQHLVEPTYLGQHQEENSGHHFDQCRVSHISK